MVDVTEPAGAQAPPRRRPEDRRRLPAVLLPSIAFFMVTLDSLVVVTALPALRRDLGGDPASLQWIVNAYSLTFAAGIVTGAALGDRYGRRRVFLAGLVAFTLASAACALAPTLELLIAARAVQGLGAAVLAPVGLTLVTTAIPPQRRGLAIGLWGGISGLGVAAGPLVGGAVTQGLDWQWVFWVNVPVGVLAVVGCARVLVESHGPRRPLDVPGMLLAAVALCTLVAGLVAGPTDGWRAPATVVPLAGAVLALAAFVVREARAAAPMIPPGLFRSRVFSAAVAANLLCAAAIFSAAFVTSAYFQVGRGYSPLATGLRFLPWTMAPLVVAPLAGALVDRIGWRWVAVPGLLLQGAGFAWIVLLARSDADWVAFVVPFVVAGVGVSLALPSLPAAALRATPAASLGAAAGVVNTSQRVGSVVGVALITAVFDAHGSLASAVGAASGFRAALAVSAGLSVLGGLVALVGGGTRRQHDLQRDLRRGRR